MKTAERWAYEELLDIEVRLRKIRGWLKEKAMAELKVLTPSEFSYTFHQGMVDRMEVSFHKYGLLTEAYPHKVDAIASLEKRLAKYKEDGNTEWLMDLANFAMIEFMLPRHPKAHFRATDSQESPGRTWNVGADSSKRNADAPFSNTGGE